MGVLNILLLLYIPYPGLYNKTHMQSVYNAIRRKLKPGYYTFILTKNIIILFVSHV